MTAPPELGAAVVSMEEATGSPAIDCRHGSTIDGALVLTHEQYFLLLTPGGDITPAGHCGLGLFHDDTRLLSHYMLRVSGGPAVLLSAQARRMYTAQIDLAITDRAFGGTDWNVENAIHVRRELLLDSAFSERLTLTNYLEQAVDVDLTLEVGCDFADIFEVRGWKRPARGTFHAPQVTTDSITFGYRGRDGLLLRSRICFATAPRALDARRACWRLHLDPHEPAALEWQVSPVPASGAAAEACVRPPSLADRLAPVAASYGEWRAHCTRYHTDVEEFDASLEQAVTDMRALYVRADGQDVISAGIPWYATPFGRDSIITSLQTLGLNPQIAVDTLHYLARHQGVRSNPVTEEQPGKIMHELRRGEMARSGEIPHTPYFGTIDATPLWLVLLHEAWRWTGDDALVRALLPNAARALAWIDDAGDLDGDGFVEYATTSPNGLVNQGWKDSWNGVPFPDGHMPEPPIALVEVQGYVYDAKRRMAALYDAFGEPDRARHLREQATRLRREIIDRFWLPELGTFALALDGHKQPVPTATTNAGHLLWSRVPGPAQVQRMARQLLEPDMFCGWGIRTVSAAHPVFNPMSYHNGSVWPHDNAIVALGLSLSEHKQAATPIFTALHEAAAGMRGHRLPELFCGMTRERGLHPVLYPVSCSPQAWASGAFFMLLQGITGIFPDASERMLHIREPLLPPFLHELVIEEMRIGSSRVSLQFTRRGDRTLANLIDVKGEPLRVRIDLR